MIRQGNDPSRLIPLGLGVGLCIASTEVLRYTALWPVGTGSPAGHYAELIVLFTLGYALLGLLGHADSRPLWRHRGLMAAIAAFSSAGVAVRALIATGVLDANVPLASIVRFAMEAPYFLMAFWASRLLHLDARQSARAVTLGIVIAGGIQILESLLLGSAVSYAIAALLAPASVALLPHRSETEDEVRAPDRSDGPTPTSGALLVLTCALITVASMAVFVIHTQWTGVQDSGAASLSVQICTGLGMVGAGALLHAAASHLMPSSVFDFCFMLVLPAALAGLYLSKAADPLALVVSVVPLNVVYATLLFFVWCIPSICRFALAPQTLSLLAFYLKRVGILICPLAMGACRTLGIGLAWFTFGTIVLLVALYIANYLLAHGVGAPAAAQGQGVDPYGPACARVAAAGDLTPRETEVLALLGRGRTARHIGGDLGMSDATVKTHIAHIYRKLGVNTQQALLDVVEDEVRTGGR